MRGIYDGSTTGQRSMLSRALNPFSKRKAADDAQDQKKTAAPGPASDRKSLSPKEAQDKVLDDLMYTIPGGLNADGTPRKLKMKPGTDIFMRFVARQNAPSEYRPSPPKPANPPSQL